ncbi:alpha-ketoglutarate-dependent taurine dioxygenase [Eremomyces bilateralis CBS 781.70]|uniref:Alpha-ketoglutarate-dependent taurine dioxygenase n=1 Tax=Eremomyces bilateralis CBS 781.70 TaxID=1392243 RepID=A0A6G1FQF4_9PEZI|nr:alpha-ketoglutarate-dependent taurine dioxygenase [Eremomyces bilateralis CBS 781.70]KAF1807993.1 alpha-ketoglutarate-dependent taurine dioxygenase [Eremomyces bilateralis CBS 781.70]
MATVTSTQTQHLPISVKANSQSMEEKPKVRRAIDEEGDTVAASHPHYLPVWDHGEKYAPLQPFEHIERGKGADPSFKDLLTEGSKLQHLTPTTGSEVTGVQLSKLSDAGKDQLALLVAQRKVVAFRNQDFENLPIQEALDFGGYFGRRHIHPTTGSPEGYPELHIVHRNGNVSEFDSFRGNRNSSVGWHSDVSNEKQPPGTTFLYALDVPEVGGDTGFVNQVEAYNRLSPLLKERLHGLKAIHSGLQQAESSKKRDGIVRREPVASEHPIVRTHPATGEKALFVNEGFTKSIVGFKNEESEMLLKFLYDHIGRGIDYQARVRWAPGTVVIWDNRVTSHSVIVDWTTGERRHLARITPQAEAPFETPYIPE